MSSDSEGHSRLGICIHGLLIFSDVIVQLYHYLILHIIEPDLAYDLT